MLKDKFISLVSKYNDDILLIERLWQEIEIHYSARGRYYHNLQHLKNMYGELLQCKNQIRDFDIVLFSMFYHDIIYKATAKDNEEKSADLAVKRMLETGCNNEITAKCKAHILATKNHGNSNDTDTNLFTDADLSILGSTWEEYIKYSRQIRKEYSIYPDLIYKPGRRKVLEHFLEMKSIFKTPYFAEKYESQTRKNLISELELLS